MHARLFCKTGQLAGASFEITGEATIGKNAENTIQLYPNVISGKHARIFYDEKAKSYFLEDLNSRNGTRLDGVPVQRKERLGALHIITFANTFDFFFQLLDADAAAAQRNSVSSPQAHAPVQQPEAGTASPVAAPKSKMEGDARKKTVFDDGAFVAPVLQPESEIEQAKPPADVQRTKIGVDFTPVPSFVEPSKPPKAEPSQGAAHFVLVFPSFKGGARSFDLQEGSTVIGRDVSCAIAVDDGSVSRRHAELRLNNGALTLKDLGSKNHTYIDNQKISKEVEVREGMEITFGLVKARLVRKPGK